MSATAQGAPAQRVPAWKRLGLKLKGAASDGSPAAPQHPAHANQVASPQRPNSYAAPPSSLNKRKQIPSASYPTPDRGASKRLRKDEPQVTSSPSLRKQKSVTFTDDTKPSEEPAKASTNVASAEKKKKKKAKKPKTGNARTTPVEGFSLEPALAYLRQWRTSRETWKFNKNHQTLLIKYAFDPSSVPSADIKSFYAYIRDLKGFVRTRLRETAEEIKKKDMEEGPGGFPGSAEDKAGKQQQYDEILGRLLQQQGDNGSSASFDEVDFVMRTADDDVKRRVLKRMRAEMVVDELSDAGESSTSTGASTTAAESSSQETGDNATEKRVKLNDGSQRSIRRKRKLRTADDDSSSSDSDSESDSDESSSSSSSSSGDSDDEMDMAPVQGEVETSSSSSSSSSSGSDAESGSEVDTDEEDSDAEESESESD